MQSQIQLLKEAKSLIEQFMELYPQLVAQSQEVAATAEAPATEQQLEHRISQLLQQLGVPMHIKGFIYIKTAITMAYEDERPLLGMVTKELYPRIADRYNTTATRVERAIRHAIERAADRGDKLFIHINTFSDRPTNSEFIAWCVEHLKFNK